MTAPAVMVRAEGLLKSFGDTRALDGVDLEVPAGTVLGLLGPNGAGKTTTVRVLATLLRADGGRAEVAGFDVARRPQEVRARIGLTGQYASVDENLTGRENLVMIGRLLNLPKARARARADELLERFDLADAAGRGAGTYSGGMRRRLDLAASLVGRPPVLFLDEPTTGLDPRSRLQLWEVIRELVADGTTLLLTTQYLEEADELADDIVVIDHGRVIAHGTADELKARTGGRTLELTMRRSDQVAEAAALVSELAGRSAATDLQSRTVSLSIGDDATVATAALARLEEAGLAVAELQLLRPSLDEVFLALTGHRAEPEGATA